jgi:MFS transporter, ACDE family, multidrug resistance protein
LSAVAEGECRPPERGDGIVADRGGGLPKEIWVLITANAVIALGYGVVSPVLPQYARNFGVTISAATFVITAFALMRLVFAPVSGLLVQRLGERRIYVYGILIVSLSTGACAFAQSYWQLLLFRSIGGIGSTMFFVSSLGLMIRVSPEHARGRVAGMFSTAFLVGSVGGPVVGSLTAGLGLETPFVIYGIALLIAAAVVFVSLRRSTLAAPERESEPPVSLRVALRQRAFRAALLSNFATGWSVFGLRMALVPLFVTEVLGRGPGMAGLALATFAAGNVSAVIPSGYVSDRVGRRTLMIVGLSVSGLATGIVGAASSLPLFLAGAFVAGAAAGMFSSPQQAAVADIVGSKARAGTALAAFQMMADLGSIVGSLVVGQIAQQLDFYWAFIVSGIILLVAALAWVLAPETRGRAPSGPTPARALGPVAGGEVP